MINLLNMDCMDYLKTCKDNQFDLAIVDPPYGMPKRSVDRAGKLQNRIIQGMYKKGWDIAPSEYYFIELFRVSKNQIIWGGNYFNLSPTRCVIAWDKMQPWENFSQIEMAWTSFDKPAALFKFDNRTGDKIHPTQKPVALYKWLLNKFADKENTILDTHLGSGSIAIACHDMGFDLTGIEIDKDYFEAAKKRLETHVKQLSVFDTKAGGQKINVIQTDIFNNAGT
jgi:site-specific DNA-methyltransferase (adenine-specific)